MRLGSDVWYLKKKKHTHTQHKIALVFNMTELEEKREREIERSRHELGKKKKIKQSFESDFFSILAPTAIYHSKSSFFITM